MSRADSPCCGICLKIAVPVMGVPAICDGVEIIQYNQRSIILALSTCLSVL